MKKIRVYELVYKDDGEAPDKFEVGDDQVVRDDFGEPMGIRVNGGVLSLALGASIGHPKFIVEEELL